MSLDWDRSIAEFTALGGVAENVRLRVGSRGQGLFAVDPRRPVRLLCPSHLLVPRSALTFAGGRLRVAPDSGLGARERAFIESYAEAFTWGVGGRQAALEEVAGLAALPSKVRGMLARDIRLRIPTDADPETLAQDRFLRARSIRHGGKSMIMPVVELVNHDPDGARFTHEGGIAIAGMFPGEVLVRYRTADALAIYVGWRFASRQPVAYSLPLLMNHGDAAIAIRRNFARRHAREAPPDSLLDGRVVQFSAVLLGDMSRPERPWLRFSRMCGAGLSDAAGLFARIRSINLKKFHALRDALGSDDASAELRRMCDYQLEALAHCTGPT